MFKSNIRKALLETVTSKGYTLPGAIEIKIVNLTETDEEVSSSESDCNPKASSSEIEFECFCKGVMICDGDYNTETAACNFYFIPDISYGGSIAGLYRLAGIEYTRPSSYPPIPSELNGNSLKNYLTEVLSNVYGVPLRGKLILSDPNFRFQAERDGAKVNGQKYIISIWPIDFSFIVVKGPKDVAYVPSSFETALDFVKLDKNVLYGIKKYIIENFSWKEGSKLNVLAEYTKLKTESR